MEIFRMYRNKRVSFILLLVILMLCLGFDSCKKDDSEGPNPPMVGGNKPDNFLFIYNSNNSSIFRTSFLGNTVGQTIDDGSDVGSWNLMASVQVGASGFIASHKKASSVDDKHFVIRRLNPDGTMGNETENQHWENNYENFFGFRIGTRGFIFGLDSYVGSKKWFVQEVLTDGSLAQDEASSGTWAHFWETATPMYVNGRTYLFFHRKATTGAQTNDWFISSVSNGGGLSDHQTGTWAHFWDVVTSVEVDGKTFLIGHRDESKEWFIQRINSDGTMGSETDRGNWNNFYSDLAGFVSNGKAYLLGAQGSGGWSDAKYFVQEITNDGKLGAETYHSSDNMDYHFVATFPYYDKPGSFRYTIGWDLSQNNGNPVRWSPRYDDPWGGSIKMGGGAALANIDGDSQQKPDAVLVGIKDLAGPDQFYYKVAWNLDATGKAASLSEILSGPQIGEGQAGAGADITDLDNNGLYDLILMVVDDPDGANSFRYYIGWNLNSQGIPNSWSNMKQGPTIGSFDSGGGAAIGDIDKNGRPDLVFTAVDNPAEDNNFWIVVGKNLDVNGNVQSWTPKIILPCDIGWSSAGGGAALADIDKNGKLDLVLMNIDSPSGANNFWSYIGWDIDINGNVPYWSTISGPPSPGNITSGGGTAVGDIDKNGILDLLLMTVDNPYGND